MGHWWTYCWQSKNDIFGVALLDRTLADIHWPHSGSNQKWNQGLPLKMTILEGMPLQLYKFPQPCPWVLKWIWKTAQFNAEVSKHHHFASSKWFPLQQPCIYLWTYFPLKEFICLHHFHHIANTCAKADFNWLWVTLLPCLRFCCYYRVVSLL